MSIKAINELEEHTRSQDRGHTVSEIKEIIRKYVEYREANEKYSHTPRKWKHNSLYHRDGRTLLPERVR